MRLIDADEVYKVLTDYYHHRTEIQHETLKEALSKVPTVDAVEVMRCKDCKYADSYARCKWVSWYNNKDDFCSRGERRVEDEQ